MIIKIYIIYKNYIFIKIYFNNILYICYRFLFISNRDISYNKLATIPDVLKNLKKLEYL